MQNPDRMRALLDSLGSVSEQERARLRASSSAPTTATNPLGLRFAIGAAVVDLVTGRRGVVKTGARQGTPPEELYRVVLSDARDVYRLDKELELAPAGVS